MYGTCLPQVLNMAILFGSLALTACGGGEAPPGPETGAAVELGVSGRTTRGDVAVSNLNSQITGREVALTLRPNDVSAKTALVELLLARTQYLGTYADFDRAVAIAREAVNSGHQADEAATLLATVSSALHRFKVARTLLTDIEPSRATTQLSATVSLALNDDLITLRTERQAALDRFRNFETLTGLAAVESALGRFEAADQLYLEALQTYGDVSPLPVAFVLFQRGVMWGESADRPDLALPFYREAVARVPDYVVANVHLAELEAESGQRGQAIARLRRIVDRTDDPEPAGLLGELLLDTEPEAAAAYIDRARASYDRLLSKYPAAFADHGAEFFIGPGADAERALALALGNLANRPTERAHQVAIEVAQQAGALAKACELAERVGLDAKSRVLQAVVIQTLDGC